MPRRGAPQSHKRGGKVSHRTFYTVQTTTLRYLARMAYNESLSPPGFTLKRYKFTCVCYSRPCRTVENGGTGTFVATEVLGACEALTWIVSHNRHKTRIEGVNTLA